MRAFHGFPLCGFFVSTPLLPIFILHLTKFSSTSAQTCSTNSLTSPPLLNVYTSVVHHTAHSRGPRPNSSQIEKWFFQRKQLWAAYNKTKITIFLFNLTPNFGALSDSSGKDTRGDNQSSFQHFIFPSHFLNSQLMLCWLTQNQQQPLEVAIAPKWLKFACLHAEKCNKLKLSCPRRWRQWKLCVREHGFWTGVG